MLQIRSIHKLIGYPGHYPRHLLPQLSCPRSVCYSLARWLESIRFIFQNESHSLRGSRVYWLTRMATVPLPGFKSFPVRLCRDKARLSVMFFLIPDLIYSRLPLAVVSGPQSPNGAVSGLWLEAFSYGNSLSLNFSQGICVGRVLVYYPS